MNVQEVAEQDAFDFAKSRIRNVIVCLEHTFGASAVLPITSHLSRADEELALLRRASQAGESVNGGAR